MPLNRIVANISQLGWVDGLFFLFARTLSKLSGRRARIVRYHLMAQPVPQEGHATRPSAKSQVTFRQCRRPARPAVSPLARSHRPPIPEWWPLPRRAGGRPLCGLHLARPRRLRRRHGSLSLRARPTRGKRLGFRRLRRTRFSHRPHLRPAVGRRQRTTAQRRRPVEFLPHRIVQPGLDPCPSAPRHPQAVQRHLRVHWSRTTDFRRYCALRARFLVAAIAANAATLPPRQHGSA